MKARINLSIEESVIHQVRLYAQKRSTSISEIVENYLSTIVKPVKKKTIFDLLNEFHVPDFDVNADLKDLYYRDPKHGG